MPHHASPSVWSGAAEAQRGSPSAKRCAAKKGERGFALLFVVMLLLILSAALGVMIGSLASAAKTNRSMVKRRQLFYQCDGAARLATVLTRDFLGEEANPTTANLKDYICTMGGSAGCPGPSYLPALLADGYTMDKFVVERLASPTETTLTSGTFSGLDATTMPVRLMVGITHDASGHRCELDQEISVGSVSPFQFLMVSDDDMSWVPPGSPILRGRTHVNGDYCIGGSGAAFEYAIASGDLYNHADGTHCPAAMSGTVSVWDGSNPRALTTANDSDAADWGSVQQPLWNGHVKDAVNSVPVLKLPVAATVDVQATERADGTDKSNSGSYRLLVDPVRTGESDEVRKLKLSCLADLRIINGVWYLAAQDRSSDPCGSWPGTPIWSDHPGTFTLRALQEASEYTTVGGNALDVGQNNIHDARGWSAIGGDETPRRYSYYRWRNNVAGPDYTILDHGLGADRPVVSYGSLNKQGGVFKPGHWTFGVAVPIEAVSVVCNTQLPGLGVNFSSYDNTGVGCRGSLSRTALNATRSGFTDPDVYQELSSLTSDNRIKAAAQMPINFDVQAFRAALQDTAVGELGAIFPANAGNPGRRFNGIIWIGNTWVDSLDGFGSGTASATMYPPIGALAVGEQAPRTSSHQWPLSDTEGVSLPYELCSTEGGVAGSVIENAGGVQLQSGAAAFEVQSCDLHQNADKNRANVVRIVNAANVGSELAAGDPLPTGLTIASNNAVYLVGDANTVSATATAGSTPWVPFLVAGDTVTLLSNNWADAHAAHLPGGLTGSSTDYSNYNHDGTGPVTRTASDTTFNVSILTGSPISAGGTYGGGIENILGLLEDWNGHDLNFRGALVRGYGPVYRRWKHDGRYTQPDWNWDFDPHLASLAHQPLGSPTIDVSAVSLWRR